MQTHITDMLPEIFLRMLPRKNDNISCRLKGLCLLVCSTTRVACVAFALELCVFSQNIATTEN